MRNRAATACPTRASAWDIPSKTAAQELQLYRGRARTPKLSQQIFHIHKSADTLRAQRMAKAAI